METIEDYEDFIPKVVESEDKYLVLFYADWCPYCTKFKVAFEKYEGKFSYKMVGAKVNEDENPLWDLFKIESVPTMIAFDNGEIVCRRDAVRGVGLTSADMESIAKELQN
ncbi:MAG: thioredoxin family protein [Nitrososphaerales archaeon]